MFLYSLYTRVQIAFASPATVAFASTLMVAHAQGLPTRSLGPLMAVLRDNVVCQGLVRLLLLLEERIQL